MNCSTTNRQPDFWQSLVREYETRNLELQETHRKLQQRLKEMESTIPASILQSNEPNAKRPQSGNASTSSFSKQCPHSHSIGKDHLNKPTSATDVCNCNSYLENVNFLSLGSTDLEYVKRVQELSNIETQIKNQIQEMRHREQAYMETLRQADEMWACMDSCYKDKVKQIEENENEECLKYEKLNEQLSEENGRLGDELRNVKLKLKQASDRMKGPLSEEFEKEKRRSKQLERELQSASQRMANKKCSCTQEINNVLDQLKCATGNICKMNIANERLKEDISALQNQYNNLQQDLISQKLLEVHTLERLRDMMDVEEESPCEEFVVTCKDENLSSLEKELSKTLGEVEYCDECKCLPADLINTVEGIKDIVDLVNTKKKRHCNK